MEDAPGFRPAHRRPVPLDGRSTRCSGRAVGAGLRLVAVRCSSTAAAPEPDESAAAEWTSPCRPGATRTPPTGTHSRRADPVRGPVRRVEPAADGTGCSPRWVDLSYFSYTGADLLATAFPVPADVPVACPRTWWTPSAPRSATSSPAIVGDTALLLRVDAVVPDVPSAPGQLAVLADTDTLSRALIDAGRLDPVVDAWWVADPQRADRALRADLGEVVTRAGVAAELAGAVRVTVPTVLVAGGARGGAAPGRSLVTGAATGGGGRSRWSGSGPWACRGARPRGSSSPSTSFLVPLVVVGTLVGAATVLLGPH